MREPYKHRRGHAPAPSTEPKVREHLRCLLCGAARLPEKFTGGYDVESRMQIIGGYKHIKWVTRPASKDGLAKLEAALQRLEARLAANDY